MYTILVIYIELYCLFDIILIFWTMLNFIKSIELYELYQSTFHNIKLHWSFLNWFNLIELYWIAFNIIELYVTYWTVLNYILLYYNALKEIELY